MQRPGGNAPAAAQLRSFGLTLGAVIAVLFGIVLPWRSGAGVPLWPWPAAVLLWLWALLQPRTLAPLYRAWMGFGLLMNRLLTPLLLALLFFLVLLPIGLVLRASGRDPLDRGRDPARASYRIRSKPLTRDGMERPF